MKITVNKRVISFSFIFFAYFLFIAKAYYQHFAAFGCFDECFNYVTGYFMLKERHLYENIFFNHQPLMAYLSYFIQLILHPSSIYHLVLYHKMFVLLFSFLLDVILIIRFRLFAIGFVFFYEATKFYFMGNFFIPEALIVYPLVYMIGIIFLKFTGKQILPVDIILSGIFTWFVIFMREPYVPLALIMYFLILLNRKMFYSKLISFIVFLLLSFLILNTLNLREYVSQVIENNFNSIFQSEVKSNQILGLGLFKVFLYPFYILIEGKWTFLKSILLNLDLLFLFSILVISLKIKNFFIPLIALIILGFSNMRVVSPGKMFYESFHMVVWYALFLFSIFFFLYQIYSNGKTQKTGYALIFFALMTLLYVIFSPNSFLRENIDKEKQYLGNFDQYYIFGEAVRLLSKPGDTLFIDGGNDLIYWQANLDSAYQYSTYPGNDVKKFELAKNEMFQKNPPDFYYYYLCSGKKYGTSAILTYGKQDYIQLKYLDKNCLYMKKSKIASISKNTLDKLKVLRFYLD